MLKGCLNIIALLIVLTGTLYYVYEKHEKEVNAYVEENFNEFYEENIKDAFNNFSSDYSDSVKIFLKKVKNENVRLSEEKLEELKKKLNEFARKNTIDSVDFKSLKKIFSEN